MSQPIATNHFVWVKRDETPKEKSGFIIPDQGKKKPKSGTILSPGSLVKDFKIKNGKGKKALFHEGVGQEIEYDGETYLVLEDMHIIAVI